MQARKASSGNEKDESVRGLLLRAFGSRITVALRISRLSSANRQSEVAGASRRSRRKTTRMTRVESKERLQQLSIVIPKMVRPSWSLLFSAIASVAAIVTYAIVLSAFAWLVIVALAALPWADAQGKLEARLYLGSSAAIYMANSLLISTCFWAAFDNFSPGSFEAVWRRQWFVIMVVIAGTSIPYLVLIYAIGLDRSTCYRLGHMFGAAFSGVICWATNYILAKDTISFTSYLVHVAKKQARAERDGKPPPRKPLLAWAVCKKSLPVLTVMAVACVYFLF